MKAELTPLRRPLLAAALMLLLVWLVCCAFYAPNGINEYRQKRAELKRMQGEVLRLQKENGALGHEVELLREGDRFTIERAAREQGLAKPGEFVYRMEPGAKGAGTAAK